MLTTARDEDRPWNLTAPADITALTIHQAKGREFDNVLIAHPKKLVRQDGSDEQLELLYVALTRARSRVCAIDFETPWSDAVNGTRMRVRKHPGTKAPKAVTIETADLRSDGAIGGESGQAMLCSAPSDSLVTFELLNSPDSYPMYRALIDGQVVAATTEEFGRSLAKVVSKGRWPSLGSVPLENVESRVSPGPPSTVWLKPRIAGYIDLEFSKALD